MNNKFDFDEWTQLYESDSDKFEQKRGRLLDELIKSVHPLRQAKMKGLKFRLDTHSARSNSNISKLVYASHVMWDSFSELNGLLQSLNDNSNSPKQVKLHLVSDRQNKPTL